MIGIVSILRLFIEGGCIKSVADNPVTSSVTTFVIGIVWLFGIVLLVIGYWAYIHILFHCEYDLSDGWNCSGGGWLYYMTGNISLISSGSRASPYMNHFKSYYVGYTIVLFGMSMINLYDMGFTDAFKAVKLAFGKR